MKLAQLGVTLIVVNSNRALKATYTNILYVNSIRLYYITENRYINNSPIFVNKMMASRWIS